MSNVIHFSGMDCRDCYKCIRNCPVKAIRYADGRAEIIESECILCGECVVTCPQRGDFVESSVAEIRARIAAGEKVVASVDPSFISDLPVGSIEGMRQTLRQLGFFDADETAKGCEVVSREYERIMQEDEMDMLISSCCPAVVMLIQRYYPDVLLYLAPVKSPVDYCITFYELREWMRDLKVKPVRVERDPADRKRARRYPRQDGLVKSMTPVPGWNRVAIDGVNDCIAALSEIRHGGVTKTFLEMTACEGSCVNGPAIRRNRAENRIRGTVAVNEYSGNDDFGIVTDVELRRYHAPEPVVRAHPSEEDVQKVLQKLGKDTKSRSINCGCCGYATCRQMAIAICRGTAQLDMCLPYVREKAESHSHDIIASTLETADSLIDKQMRTVQNIASLLGETTAETKVILTKLKEAVQSDE